MPAKRRQPAPKAKKRKPKAPPKPPPKKRAKAAKRGKPAPAKPAKKRAKKRAPAKAAAKKRHAKQSSAAAKKQAKAAKAKRSSAAKRGHAKLRKQRKLFSKMADLRMEAAAKKEQLPLGWSERRGKLIMRPDGSLWRQIVMIFDPKDIERERLEILKELEIDLLGKDDLYDYLKWTADHFDMDIGDMYRMYLGYPVGAVGGDEGMISD